MNDTETSETGWGIWTERTSRWKQRLLSYCCDGSRKKDEFIKYVLHVLFIEDKYVQSAVKSPELILSAQICSQSCRVGGARGEMTSLNMWGEMWPPSNVPWKPIRPHRNTCAAYFSSGPHGSWWEWVTGVREARGNVLHSARFPVRAYVNNNI